MPPLSSLANQLFGDRDNGENARLLDGRSKPTLVLGTYPGSTPRQNLSGVRDKAAQHPAVSIGGDFLFAGAERANLGPTAPATTTAVVTVALVFVT